MVIMAMILPFPLVLDIGFVFISLNEYKFSVFQFSNIVIFSEKGMRLTKEIGGPNIRTTD